MGEKESNDIRLFLTRSCGAAATASRILNRQMKGRRTTLVSPDGISPVCEQRPNGGGATCSHGAMQRRHTTLVFRIRICASLYQELNDRILSSRVPGSGSRNPIGRVVERFSATSVSGANVCTSRDKVLGDVSLVSRSGDVQWGIASVGVVPYFLEVVRACRFATRSDFDRQSCEHGRFRKQP
jgi:hypothetical protein